MNHRVLGAGAAVIGAMLLLTAFGASGECPCPQCGYRITGIGRTLSCCPSCGQYSMVKNRKLLRPDDDFVSTVRRFAVEFPWDDLGAARRAPIPWGTRGAARAAARPVCCPRVVPATWPAMCAVCGRPSAKEEAVKVTLVRRAADPGASRDEELDLIAFVPHCDEHKDGVSIDLFGRTSMRDGREYTVGGPALFFVSYRYYKAFKVLNPWN
jgi:hypothetical protein